MLPVLPVPPSLLALLTTIPVGVLQPVAPPAQRQDDAAIERILDKKTEQYMVGKVSAHPNPSTLPSRSPPAASPHC